MTNGGAPPLVLRVIVKSCPEDAATRTSFDFAHDERSTC